MEHSGLKSESDCLLISQAKEEYSKGNYDECLKMLEVLENSGINIKLNRAIVQFFKTGCKNHTQLLEELKQVTNDEPRRAMPIILYNMAVIYFHRHMYYTAIETLNPLMDKLDSFDLTVSTPIAILMLRLLLGTGQTNKASAFLDAIQTKLGVGISDNLNEEQTAANETVTASAELARSFRLLSMMTQVFERKSIVVPEDAGAEFSALKAHQYYINKDFQMASKQLLKINEGNCSTDRADDLSTCIANNMGVIHLRVRHYAIAAKFFQNALIFDKNVTTNLASLPLQNMSLAHSCEILYNLGIALLHLKRPKEAFQCLLTPLKKYHCNPRIWVRLAEACIMEYERVRNSEERSSLSVLLAAMGVQKNLTLKPKPRVFYRKNTAAVPEPTLEFAALCMRNALMLTEDYGKEFIETNGENSSDSTRSGHWRQARDNNFCTPSKPLPSKASLQKLRSSIYASYSYISLCLGDYIKALDMAQELLKQEQVSDAHKMLGHMYIAEALIMLDRPKDASPHMEYNLDKPLNTFDFETKDWQVKSLEAAQNICRYNFAVALVLQGELDGALTLLKTCNHAIVSPKVIALKMHIELKKTTVS